MKIEYFGIPSNHIFTKGEKIYPIFVNALKQQQLALKENDIIAISSKIVALEQKLVVELEQFPLHPDKSLLKLITLQTGLDERFASLIIHHSDIIFGGVKGALLTLRKGILQANAGIDRSNTPKGTAILPPDNPDQFADMIVEKIRSEFNINVHILIIDSATRPLRRGTTGLCLGSSKNFPDVIDERGSIDLLGNEMHITTRAIADNLATACNLIMGESDEGVPFVLVRNAPVEQWSKSNHTLSMQIPYTECLYFKNFSQTPIFVRKEEK